MSESQFLPYSSKSALILIFLVSIFISLAACQQNEKALPNRSLDHPVVFIGLDGAEWEVIRPMLDRGELPNIRTLMNAGVHNGLINPGAMVSPAVWSTFITGEQPRVHGILDHVFPFDDSQSKQPVNSTLRLSPALWNIASNTGLRSAVMGYFVSWPAEDILGVVVSDRAMAKFPDSVYPKSRESKVYKIVSELTSKKARKALLHRYYHWGYDHAQAEDPNDPHFKAANLIIGRADRLLINDEIIRRNVATLQASAYDFVSVYYRSIDLASHSFWREYENAKNGAKGDSELTQQLGDVIPEAYRFVDEAIGELMEKFGTDANYIVVSDHGFGPARRKIMLSNKYHSILTGNHLPVGIFIASGPDIVQQESIEDHWQVTTLDIFPTILHLLDLPVSLDQPGRVLQSIISKEYSNNHRLQKVKKFVSDDFARPYNSASTVDQKEEMNSLAGLGYISGNTRDGASGNQEYNYWASTEDLLLNHAGGEIVEEIINNRYPSAGNILKEFLEKKPELEKKILKTVKVRLYAIANSNDINQPVNARKLYFNLIHKFKLKYPNILTPTPEKVKNQKV